MREIKFRGKRKDTGEWVYGYYVFNEELNEHFIYTGKFIEHEEYKEWEAYKVIPETMGQYTGIKDCNKQEIYEEDIVKCGFYAPSGDKPTIGEIVYRKEDAGYMLKTAKPEIYFFSQINANVEIIGNKHENPEIFEEEKQC